MISSPDSDSISSSQIKCLCWNPRSINNKVDNLMQYVINNNITIFFITETWLTESNNHTTAVIKSYGYKISHNFRPDFGGGGVAVVHKHCLKLVKIFPKHAKTFESVSVKLKFHDNSWLFCCCIYRTGPTGTFISDFDDFLSDIFVHYDRILICGDINIHLDNQQSSDTKKFIDVIESYGLNQLVEGSTHKAGHTLDVVISSHQVVSDNNVRVIYTINDSNTFPTCDHYPLNFSISGKPSMGDNTKIIKFRNIRSISNTNFCREFQELINSSSNFEDLSFSDMISLFNSSCIQLLDSHAPLLTKTIRDVPSVPGFDTQYKEARKRRRNAEKMWKKSGLQADYEIFDYLRSHCSELIKSKNSAFYKSQLAKYSNSQKSLFKFANTFLDQSQDIVLPPSESLQSVVDEFNQYFTDKINLIRSNFPDSSHEVNNSGEIFSAEQKLTEFKSVTVEDIRSILKDSGIKTSSIDPLPSTILEEDIDSWLPLICNLVNTSIKTGSIEGAKLAHLSPLIKGQSLDSSDLKNYRPISNLSFIGKLIERVVLKQLTEHLDANNLNIPNQSGYKKHHSTETLLVRIVNDILVASDEGSATIVMLLDLSAAFDTVDHRKLLHILKTEVGIDGIALKWFESFLCGRCQKVKINEFESSEIIIMFGVPQGSVLGPVLFNIYIRSLYRTVQSLHFHIQGFADDHQIYKPFQSNREYSIVAHELPLVFHEIEKWMSLHFLQLNPGKTEIIVFGSSTVVSQLQTKGSFIAPSVCVRFVDTAKNLGLKLDACLTFKPQIKALKSSCFNKLRKIAKMHSFLNPNQLQTLVQAIVISSLDYCNSLYFGISPRLLNQLQIIQNRACRTIFGLKKRDNVDKYLKNLHWLKINQRIEFKILLLVFKSINGLAPTYLKELISYNNVSGSRLPSLQTPISQSSRMDRAFINYAPRLWNSLPISVKQSDNIHLFKKRLKQYLFNKSHPLAQ